MRRSLVLLTVAASAAIGSFAPPAGAQAVHMFLEVAGSPVRPGDAITVSAGSCAGPSSTVLVGLLDADSESSLASVAVDPAQDGEWRATITVPANVRPGSYPLTARCVTYTGDASDGYTGGGYDGVDIGIGMGRTTYEPFSIRVLPPTAPPAPDGALTVTPDVVGRGDSATVTGGGWTAGESVTVFMYSEPAVLREDVVTDATGAISVTVSLPDDVGIGPHTVFAMNPTSALRPARTLGAQITVAAPVPAVTPAPLPGPAAAPPARTQVLGTANGSGSALPFTGSSPWSLVVLGSLLVVTGSALHTVRRRSGGT
jgi:hypothetical protein